MQRAYGYVYDPLNRLLQGDFVARTTGTTTSANDWRGEADNYRLSFASYDDNGNLKTLRRRGLLANATHTGPKQFGAVDNLSYAYAGNRLQAVDDQVSTNQLPRPAGYEGAPTSLAGDFQEGGLHQSQEYLYDANGSMTVDRNKGISAIAYNHLNLPRLIHFGMGADSIVFRYTAAGQKVAKLVYQHGKPLLRTDYLGPYQYEQDSLRFFPHAEGRVLRLVSTDAAGQATVSYAREFSFKDHLGNLRLAYRAGLHRRDSVSLEPAAHARESQQFDSLSVSAPVAQNVGSGLARSGSYAARLNAGGTTPQPLGPLKQLAVQKGDTVTVTAYGLYAQPVRNNFWFSLASFLTGILQPAGGTSGGPDPSRGRGGLPLLQVGVATGLATLPQLSNGVPKGYLRLLVFNADSVLVSQQTQPLTSAALNNYQPLHLSLLVPQDGYVTTYVGNESDVDVLFDDVTVVHGQGLQVQETQYDPTGLEMAGLDGTTPGLKPLSQYKWNGKEFQTDLGLNWNHQDWRFFDPQIWRWPVGDPEIENGQESWTPYSFGYDNAVRYADADGRCPGGCPPTVLQAGALVSELGLLLEEAGPVLQNAATAIGLTAALAWVGNHLPSAQQVGDALSHSSAGAAAPPGMYSPYTQMYTDSKMQASVNANGRVNANTSQPASASSSSGTASSNNAGTASGGPKEPYNRRKHYGNTPTKADRTAVGAGKDQVADHDPPLVKRYYEGDPKTGEKPGYQMTPAERKASGGDRTRMQPQPAAESNSQGGQMSRYSREKKKAYGL